MEGELEISLSCSDKPCTHMSFLTDWQLPAARMCRKHGHDRHQKRQRAAPSKMQLRHVRSYNRAPSHQTATLHRGIDPLPAVW